MNLNEWSLFICFPHHFQAGRGLFVSVSSGSRVSWRALGEWTDLFIFLPQLVGHSIWTFLSSTHICIFLNVATVSRSFACFHCIFNNYWVFYLVYFWNIVPDFVIFVFWALLWELYSLEKLSFSYPGTLRVWLECSLIVDDTTILGFWVLLMLCVCFGGQGISKLFLIKTQNFGGKSPLSSQSLLGRKWFCDLLNPLCSESW